MRTIIQRVKHSSVKVDDVQIATISQGLLALVGFSTEDTPESIHKMLEKIVNLRIFADERGRFNFSLSDIKGDLLLVPQFTLFADTSRGRRPEFFQAAPPEIASPLFDRSLELARTFAIGAVAGGQFGANMQVLLENDGPVTIAIGF